MAKIKKAQSGAPKVKSVNQIDDMFSTGKGKPSVRGRLVDIERSYDTTGYAEGRKRFPKETKYTYYDKGDTTKIKSQGYQPSPGFMKTKPLTKTPTTVNSASRREVDKAIKTPLKKGMVPRRAEGGKISKQKSGGKTVLKKAYGGMMMKKGGKMKKSK